MRRRRRGADVVVAGQREHAAVGRRAGVVGMLEDVHRAVDTRPLAVPDGKDALVLGAGEEPHLLRAPERGGRRILVDAGLEVHAVLLQERLRLPERTVEIAERRASVARDHAGRVEPGRLVPQVLDHRQPDQRLGAGHVDVPRRGGVLVVESDCDERHRYSCPQRPALLGARPQAAAARCAAAPPSYPMAPRRREGAACNGTCQVIFCEICQDGTAEGVTRRRHLRPLSAARGNRRCVDHKEGRTAGSERATARRAEWRVGKRAERAPAVEGND